MSFYYPGLVADLISPSARSHVSMAALTYNHAAGADAYQGGRSPTYTDRAMSRGVQEPGSSHNPNRTYQERPAMNQSDHYNTALGRIMMDYLRPRPLGPAYATR